MRWWRQYKCKDGRTDVCMWYSSACFTYFIWPCSFLPSARDSSVSQRCSVLFGRNIQLRARRRRPTDNGDVGVGGKKRTRSPSCSMVILVIVVISRGGRQKTQSQFFPASSFALNRASESSLKDLSERKRRNEGTQCRDYDSPGRICSQTDQHHHHHHFFLTPLERERKKKLFPRFSPETHFASGSFLPFLSGWHYELKEKKRKKERKKKTEDSIYVPTA